jgi:hypothetical protein
MSLSSCADENEINKSAVEIVPAGVYIYLVIGIYRAIEVNTVSTQIDVVKCHHFTIYGFHCTSGTNRDYSYHFTKKIKKNRYFHNFDLVNSIYFTYHIHIP